MSAEGGKMIEERGKSNWQMSGPDERKMGIEKLPFLNMTLLRKKWRKMKTKKAINKKKTTRTFTPVEVDAMSSATWWGMSDKRSPVLYAAVPSRLLLAHSSQRRGS